MMSGSVSDRAPLRGRTEATPSIRQPIPYRGYTFTRCPAGLEVRHTLEPDRLITVSPTLKEAEKEVDEWLWGW